MIAFTLLRELVYSRKLITKGVPQPTNVLAAFSASELHAKKGTRLKIKIGIFGTYLSDRMPRKTIGQALEHSAENLGVSVECQ